MSKIRILITGSEGFVGCALSDKLVQFLIKIKKKYEICFLDKKELNFSNKLIKFYQNESKNLFLKNVQKDLIDENLEKNIGKFDVILHLAALIDATESVSNPSNYFKNNLEVTKNLLNCIKINGSFIFASSAAVYGIPNKVPSNEIDETKPITPYGETKILAEKEIINYKRVNKFNYQILRFFNIAGSYKGKVLNSDPNFEKNLFSQIKNRFLKNEKFIIDGSNYVTKDGTCERDFVEIEWLSRFLSKLIINSANQGSFITNVGCGKPISILQLAKALSKINPKFSFEIGKPRQVEIPRSYADIKRLLNQLKLLNLDAPPSNVNEIAQSIGIEEVK